MNKIFNDITTERLRQITLWGVQSLKDGTGQDEWARAILVQTQKSNDALSAQKRITWIDVLEEEFLEVCAETNLDNLRTELIQLAAVCCSWVDDIDKRKIK